MAKNGFIKFFGNLIQMWWCFWSNIRFKNALRFDIETKDEDKAFNLKDIRELVSKLYNKFEWTEDGIDQLWDALTPPPQTYKHYLDGLLKDDCDGFHALVYHCLSSSDIECYLLTANTFSSGHCVLIFRLDNKWHVNDYSYVYKGFDTIEEAIEDYNLDFPKVYNTKEVIYNGLVEYDYTKGKYKTTSIKKIMKGN